MPKAKRKHRAQSHDFNLFEDLNQIRADMRELMEHKDQQKRFICPHRLKDELWVNHRVDQIEAFQGYDQKGRTEIRQRFLKVLSILIFIEWNDLTRFEPVFVKENLNDGSLPFTRDQIRDMETGVDYFLDAQYIFIPQVIIQKTAGWIQSVPADFRLPFLDTENLIAMGGFGEVTRREIAPHCREDWSNNLPSRNDCVSVPHIAVSIY